MKLRFTSPDTPEEFEQIDFDNVDSSFTKGAVVKNGETQSIRICVMNGRKFAVKQYRTNGLFSGLRTILGKSRAHNSLRYAYLLRAHQVACPAHILVVTQWALRSSTTYLVMEYTPGHKLHHFLISKEKIVLKEKTIAAAIQTIRSFHSLGLAHGDLHTENLILRDESTVQLIDLDNVLRSKHRQKKDLLRLIKSIKHGRQNTEDLLRAASKLLEQLKK